MAPPELTFKPRPVGPMPTMNLTPVAEWAPFTKGEMVDNRNRFVDDGDGNSVWEAEIHDTDRTRGPLCMNQVWRTNVQTYGYKPGDTCAMAFGVYLPPGMPTPPSWFTLAEMHTPIDSPQGYFSPMCAVTLDNGVLRVANNALGAVVGEVPYSLGRWHYFVIVDKLARAGSITAWHRLDLLPDLASTPWSWSGETVPPSGTEPNWTKYGPYRDQSHTDGMVHRIRYDGPVEAATAARALELLRAQCRPQARGGTPPPPPPPPPPPVKTNAELVAEAKTHLRLTKTAGANLKVWPPTDKNSEWYKALALLDQIK